jgi:hypothetical protein
MKHNFLVYSQSGHHNRFSLCQLKNREGLIRKNDTICFEGQWIQLEDIMLTEVNHVQKDKGYMFSLICGR